MKTLVPILIGLLLSACGGVSNPSEEFSASSVGIDAAWETPSLGVMVDEGLKIAWVIPDSAAEKAGVQIGDVLIELRLVDGKMISDAEGAMEVDEGITPIAVVATPLVGEGTPTPDDGTRMAAEEGSNSVGTIEPNLREPIPFTNRDAIKELLSKTMTLKEVTPEPSGPMNYAPQSGPFILKVQRGDQILELSITAENPMWIREGEPTPTTVPFSIDYF